ncbi:enoyl-CoA hydratase/isomerase family protein [Shimia sp. R11_0]|uniref:enoyl-CoA hydratase/isomerase family protein n=1 Tax=Shimia sp. R11_0 TaxID=2821096 RepID=UPI001ADC8570|nr:enoyl-CoA hydratase/isomerase family protein [Shimia sp. R11_0]MBO9477103.1 enoyl-CoA hydratase/isomerase family protein [Shimia sp. R11_0]
MSIVTYETRGKTALLTLNNGENRQNPAFAQAMLAALQQAEEDKSIRSVVITSSDEKNWSQGVDLNWLMAAKQAGNLDDMRGFMNDMNEVFARLLTFPMPVIAAITGHAFGNGAMLACACDFRFMRADRGYFCFPEVDINIPFLPSMIAYVRKAIPEYRFNELKLTGRRATATELEADHVLTAAPDAEATLEAALAFAATFSKGRGIFGEHKRRMYKDILDTMARDDAPLIAELKLTV